MNSLRIGQALSRLERAQRLIEGAARAICPVENFADEWSSTVELYSLVKEQWHVINSRYNKLSADEAGPTRVS